MSNESQKKTTESDTPAGSGTVSGIGGIIPAVVSPFDQSGAVDSAAARVILQTLKERGVNGLFVAGSTGEAWALDDDERVRLAEIAVEVADGELCVLAGSGRSATRTSVALAKRLAAAGVTGIVLPPPDFVRPSEEELFAYFVEVASAVSCTVALYNIPQLTGYGLSPALAVRVANAAANVRALKDSSGDITLTLDFRCQLPDRVAVLTGADPLLLPLLLAGGQGAVLGSAGVFPELAVAVFDCWRRKDLLEAQEAQLRLVRFWLFACRTTLPAAYKAAAEIVGLPAGTPRRPVVPLSPDQREQLREIIESMGALR